MNDAKISDHHDIIPTVRQSQQAVAALNDDELKVYTLITNNFIAQFFSLRIQCDISRSGR